MSLPFTASRGTPTPWLVTPLLSSIGQWACVTAIILTRTTPSSTEKKGPREPPGPTCKGDPLLQVT